MIFTKIRQISIGVLGDPDPQLKTQSSSGKPNPAKNSEKKPEKHRMF